MSISTDTRGGQMIVDHDDPRCRAALQDYLGVLDDGGSAVVRPRAAYAGWERALAWLRGAAPSPLLVTDLAGAVEFLPRPVAQAAPADQDVVAFHTSGSTGSPSCVVHGRDRVLGHADVVADVLRLARGTTYVALPPVQFAYGLSIAHSHARARVPVRFLDPATSAADLGAALAGSEAPVVVYALPQQVSRLLDLAPGTVDLGTVVVAGGRLTARAALELARQHPGVELVNMYGQAELGPRLATWRGPASAYAEGLVGRPIPGARLELGESRAGAARELLAGSRYAALAVLRSPYDVAVPGPAQDTLVPTGDLAEETPDGFVFRGRTGRFGNVAGTRVDLAELEALAERELPLVAARVSSRASAVTGDDTLVLQAVPAPGADVRPGDVRRRLHPVLGSMVALLEVRVVTQLEVGESGK